MRTLTVKPHVNDTPGDTLDYLDVVITDKGEGKAYVVAASQEYPGIVYWCIAETLESYRVKVVAGVAAQCECLAAQHRPNLVCRHRAATAKLMTMNKLAVS